MCGRFTIAISVGFFDRFAVPKGDWEPRSRFNVAPSQDIPVILAESSGNKHTLTMMHWGLTPSWSKNPSEGHHPINARAETLTERQMFRTLLATRRCLIPASGFFEWKTAGKEKIPYYIHRKDDTLFGFAGLYDIWKGDEGPVHSCTIITTEPNAVIASIHSRMPVILFQEDEDHWLGTEPLDPPSLQKIFTPYPAAPLEAYRVSKLVNNPGNDSPEVLAPVEDGLM